jgi:hypothetical protein
MVTFTNSGNLPTNLLKLSKNEFEEIKGKLLGKIISYYQTIQSEKKTENYITNVLKRQFKEMSFKEEILFSKVLDQLKTTVQFDLKSQWETETLISEFKSQSSNLLRSRAREYNSSDAVDEHLVIIISAISTYIEDKLEIIIPTPSIHPTQDIPKSLPVTPTQDPLIESNTSVTFEEACELNSHYFKIQIPKLDSGNLTLKEMLEFAKNLLKIGLCEDPRIIKHNKKGFLASRLKYLDKAYQNAIRQKGTNLKLEKLLTYIIEIKNIDKEFVMELVSKTAPEIEEVASEVIDMGIADPSHKFIHHSRTGFKGGFFIDREGKGPIAFIKPQKFAPDPSIEEVNPTISHNLIKREELAYREHLAYVIQQAIGVDCGIPPVSIVRASHNAFGPGIEMGSLAMFVPGKPLIEFYSDGGELSQNEFCKFLIDIPFFACDSHQGNTLVDENLQIHKIDNELILPRPIINGDNYPGGLLYTRLSWASAPEAKIPIPEHLREQFASIDIDKVLRAVEKDLAIHSSFSKNRVELGEHVLELLHFGLMILKIGAEMNKTPREIATCLQPLKRDISSNKRQFIGGEAIKIFREEFMPVYLEHNEVDWERVEEKIREVFAQKISERQETKEYFLMRILGILELGKID